MDFPTIHTNFFDAVLAVPVIMVLTQHKLLDHSFYEYFLLSRFYSLVRPLQNEIILTVSTVLLSSAVHRPNLVLGIA